LGVRVGAHAEEKWQIQAEAKREKGGKRKKEGVVGDGEIRNGDASISQFNNPI